MAKYIKNDVVSMDWNAEHFYESRMRGFIAAAHVYKTPDGDVPVVFQDKNIFILIDPEEGTAVSIDEVKDMVKTCFDGEMDISEYYEDCYVLLGIASVDEEDIAESYGLTKEDIKDINNRVQDLMGYWEIVEFTM